MNSQQKYELRQQRRERDRRRRNARFEVCATFRSRRWDHKAITIYACNDLITARRKLYETGQRFPSEQMYICDRSNGSLLCLGYGCDVKNPSDEIKIDWRKAGF